MSLIRKFWVWLRGSKNAEVSREMLEARRQAENSIAQNPHLPQ
jgi:hypothetical protein